MTKSYDIFKKYSFEIVYDNEGYENNIIFSHLTTKISIYISFSFNEWTILINILTLFNLRISYSQHKKQFHRLFEI